MIRAFFLILTSLCCGSLLAQTATTVSPSSPMLPMPSSSSATVITSASEKSADPIAVTVNSASNSAPAVAITVNQPNNAVTCPKVVTPLPKIAPPPTAIPRRRPVPLVTNRRIPIHPTPSVDIVIYKKFKNSPKVQRLYKLLGFTNSPDVIHLVDDPSIANKQDAIIAFKQRTFLSSLYYLRNAVEINQDMVDQGLVDVPRYKNGKYYDPTVITKGVMSIRLSDKRPTRNVNVAVHYRNHWFYIQDNDLSSKRTFALIQLIFNLTSGNKPASQSAPMLTIPVGR